MGAQLGDVIYAERLGIGGKITVQEIVNLVPAGGTPAGANTQIQFNNNGAFGASDKLTFDSTTGAIGLQKIKSEPTTKATENTALIAKDMEE